MENINARLSPDSAAREIDAGSAAYTDHGAERREQNGLGHDADRAGRGDPSGWTGAVGYRRHGGADWGRLADGGTKWRQKALEEFARELPALMDNYSREIWMLEGRMIKESKDHILAVKEEYQSRYQAVYEKLRQGI